MSDESTPLFDPSRLTELSDLFGPEELGDLIVTLGEEVMTALQQARDAHAAHDLRALADAAHALRNSGRMVGASRLAVLATEVERRARNEPEGDDLGEMIQQLDACWRASEGVISAAVVDPPR